MRSAVVAAIFATATGCRYVRMNANVRNRRWVVVAPHRRDTRQRIEPVALCSDVRPELVVARWPPGREVARDRNVIGKGDAVEAQPFGRGGDLRELVRRGPVQQAKPNLHVASPRTPIRLSLCQSIMHY